MAPNAPGRACIHGTVERAPGASLTLSVAIRQQGRNFKGKRDQWTHAWSEISRAVHASPFYVRDAQGERIRVEPDDKTLLVDKLDRTVRHSATIRERFADLSEGEVVYVVGELARGRDPAAGGYRDAESARVMRPPRGDRLIVSTEPLGARFERDAAQNRGWGLFCLGFIAVFAVVDIGFHARVFAGHVANGTVVEATAHDGKSSFCDLEVELANEERVEVSTQRSVCRNAVIGQRVPVYVVGASSFAHAGRAPALHLASAVVAFIVLVLTVLLYHLRTRPWYEGKVVDSGSGKL